MYFFLNVLGENFNAAIPLRKHCLNFCMGIYVWRDIMGINNYSLVLYCCICSMGKDSVRKNLKWEEWEITIIVYLRCIDLN